MDNFKNKQTKEKSTITGKIGLLIKLMKEYLHIDETESKDTFTENISTEKFISQVVEVPLETIKEEIDVYEEDLQELENNTIRYGSALLNKENRPSLLAMVAYSYKNDVILDHWLEDYASKNNTYLKNQKENYLHMKNSLDEYISRKDCERQYKEAM